MDAEGYIWNCRVVGGSCLARIAPDGRLDRIVELPCSWPTSCTFGGADLDTLFVTSARFTMTAEHLVTHPHEGNSLRYGGTRRIEQSIRLSCPRCSRGGRRGKHFEVGSGPNPRKKPANDCFWRYLLVPIDETNGNIPQPKQKFVRWRSNSHP